MVRKKSTILFTDAMVDCIKILIHQMVILEILSKCSTVLGSKVNICKTFYMSEYRNRIWYILNDAIIIVSKNSSHQGNANKKHNIIPLNTHQNGYNKKFRWCKVIAKMRGKNNSPTLLEGVQIGIANWENCLALSSSRTHMYSMN